jgi:hypothetical protein
LGYLNSNTKDTDIGELSPKICSFEIDAQEQAERDKKDKIINYLIEISLCGANKWNQIKTSRLIV